MDASSASISAEFFVITAIMPIRRRHRNEMKRPISSAAWICRFWRPKARSELGAIHSPALLQIILNLKEERGRRC
jgi:hypothetical protein